MTTLASRYITFEEFLNDPEIDERTEWVDGTLVSMHAVNNPHDRITRWLNVLLGGYVETRKLGRLLGEPFVTKLDVPDVGRSPDLMFVAADRLDLIKQNHLAGPADLVIEVISPGSRTQDRVHKKAEYELGGVTEYWLIDPEPGTFEQFRLAPDGRYESITPDSGIHTTALLPEARIDAAWFAMDDLPDALTILRDWGII